VTLLLFGGVVLALGVSVPERTSLILELGVGVLLFVLGIDVLRRLRRERSHLHVHGHGSGLRHWHGHNHEHHHPKQLPLRALVVGAAHGMAGSAALVVLSLGMTHSWSTALLYIGLFGAGSIAGMALLSAAIALPLWFTAERLQGMYSGLMLMIALCSCTLGLAIAATSWHTLSLAVH
jgi:hypothetical protein